MWIYEQFMMMNVSVNYVSKYEIFPDLDEEYYEDAENENSACETDTGYPVELDNILQKELDNILQKGKFQHF